MAYELQVVNLTATTDENGYIDHLFDNPIDQVMVCPDGPQSGTDTGVVSASARITEPNEVQVRVWVTSNTPVDWSVRPANQQQVSVTLMGVKTV